MNMQQLAMNLIARNLAISNNPQAQNFINVIQRNDSVQGEQIARNLCKSYGISEQDALNQARQFLGLG